jgi:hypothetical protein
MTALEEWRSGMVSDLDAIVKAEYNDLERLISGIEGASEDFESLSASKNKTKRDLYSEMAEIIRSQNRVINSLKAYSQ